MLKFKKHLILEATEEDKLKHLEHVEDHVIHGGSKGFAHAFQNLNDVHTKLRGGASDTKITVKYDGSPAVVFGTHPETGKFFVGSKSVFNKKPKINYTPEDIDKNHGHAPGLAVKLKAALAHLPKVHSGKGVYQADIMHTKGDVKHDGSRVHYTPNTITYHHEADSDHAKKAAAAHIGIAVHTKYEGKKFADLAAQHGADIELGEHPDVHQIGVQHDLGKVAYTQEAQSEYQKHMKAATEHYKKTPEAAHTAVAKHHVVPLKTYINQTVRDGSTPNHKDYVAHAQLAHDKKIAGVKTDAAKAKHQATKDAHMKHASDNKDHIESVLKMHHHLQQAKNILTDSLASHSEVGHEIGGAPAKPEGYVVHKNGRPSKFVARHEFSAANFARGDELKKGS
jgi:hypothetical protein